MVLANIVTKNKLEMSEEFNVVDSFDGIDTSLPTLIIGFNKVKVMFPDFDITEKQISPNLYWTFDKNERRDAYNEDIRWFIKKVFIDLIEKISYIFIDPIQYNRRTMVKIIRKLYSFDKIITLKTENMVYLYADIFIFGIDLKLLKFVGVDVEKILAKLRAISSEFLVSDEILIEYKKIISILDNKIKYLPYLYSIRHGQNVNTGILHIP